MPIPTFPSCPLAPPSLMVALDVPTAWRGWLTWDLDTWARRWLATTPDRGVPRSPFLNPAWCAAQLDRYAATRGASGYAGGYGEDRAILWQGAYLDPAHAVHLGVDWMAPAGTDVLLRGNGQVRVVEAWHDSDQAGGWGGRLVLDDHQSHWLVLAHLSLSDGLEAGTELLVDPDHPARSLGVLAPADRNGFWFPHLHVQRVPRGTDLQALDAYGTVDEWHSGAYPEPADLMGTRVLADEGSA